MHIFFTLGKFFFTKDNKYQHLTYSEKIMKYTDDLNLPVKIKNFSLTSDQLEKNDQKDNNKFNIF